MLSVWYDDSFYTARRITYVVVFAMVAFSFVAPIHYVCDEDGVSCFACGLRTGLIALMRLDIGGAAIANPLSIAIGLLVILAIADCALHLVYLKRIR